MDSTLGFIRPNIAYIPDNIINVAYHNGELSRYGNGLKQAWNEIQSKSWYKGLSVRPTVCLGFIKRFIISRWLIYRIRWD